MHVATQANMRQKFFLLLALWSLMPAVFSQECTLGIGGKDTDLIIQVFMLNAGQQQKLHQWAEALEAENGPLEDRARVLLDTHPQSTPEDLAALGHKYEEIKEAMLANARKYDRLLLGTFNPGQYQRYSDLCGEVDRRPMLPLPENPESGDSPH